MTARGWAWGAGALIACAAFAHFCVRIVPADAPLPDLKPQVASDAGALLIPVEGVPFSALTDTYTQARAGGARPHDAIDIMAARGRAVLAAGDGRIEKLFWSADGGRTIYERAADGRHIFYYAHLDSYAPGLREGQVVRRGQPIATVGSTGNADPAAPHLHFAVHEAGPNDPWHGGRPINPYPLLAPR
ncbi:MAG: M23 family metallopeptidase [Sphingomonadaceae bacterium]|nr:M23 family metallopeptidase [Sphingomonadaceae bacterium]